ncbi:reverse transcriptase domain-containing protein [Tanacetum coccineum]
MLYLKIIVLTTNTPYPSRKIRCICACTHQRPQRKQDQYAVSRNDQYAVFNPYGNKIFWKISNMVPTLRNPRYAVSKTLDTSVGYNPKNWFEKLDDALWAFRTAYKTPTGCTPFRLVYGKACHLLVEIEHKAYWALKQCNIDLTAVAKNRFMELNELIELRDGAYENTRIYKERTKRWHDSRLRRDKNFKVGDKVLLFNSRFKMHPGKLKSRWYGPNVVKIVYLYGTVEIIDRNGISFKVNGQRLKKYHDGLIDAKDKEVVEFEEDTTTSLKEKKSTMLVENLRSENLEVLES